MERIGDAVEREFTRTGSRDGAPLAAVTAAWPGVVGETVARRAWPLRIGRDGTLHVATESATWAHELALLRGEILERLAGTARERGAVRPALRGRAGSRARDRFGAASPSRSPLLVEAPPEIDSEARSAAAAVEDPELRELVARAARASLLKARSGRHFW